VNEVKKPMRFHLNGTISAAYNMPCSLEEGELIKLSGKPYRIEAITETESFPDNRTPYIAVHLREEE